MNIFQTVILIALVGNIFIGTIVLGSNWRRTVNLAFGFLAFQICFWLTAMFMCSIQHEEPVRLFWVRLTSAAGGALPLGFFAVTAAVTYPDISLRQLVRHLHRWLVTTIGVVALCFSPVFALSADPISETEPVPPTTYGWGFTIFIAYFLIVIVAIYIQFRAARRSLRGAQREEMSFLLMGACISLVSGVTILVVAEVLQQQRISGFLPMAVPVLAVFVAYGIATRRILAASVVLQRLVAYGLLIGYLVGLYALTFWISNHLLFLLLDDTAFLAHMLAAIVVGLSVSPAHGRLQAFAHQLFPSRAPLDSDTVLKQARIIFQEVATESDLTASFAGLVRETFGTPKVTILRTEPDGSFVQRYPALPAGGEPLPSEATSPLVTILYREYEPITRDMLDRTRASELIDQCRRALTALDATATAGCFMRNELKALLLLSERQTGRIYDLHDQRLLQILCDQFAVAIENSNLYTAVQNAKIYNDILLDALTSGVVAVDADRTITVFNQRAQQITGLSEATAIGRAADVLPETLHQSLDAVLDSQRGFRDRDVTIHAQDRDIPVRVSGTIFYSHTDSLLGALLAFTDMTELKLMEEQIRRSDRLSSIGTLSAGMAHEIKNPLVTIKTFTQLLPEQHEDAEFRRTFFELVDQEVKRIDTIVTRLLHFARPTKVALQPVSLHAVVEGALKLIDQQLVQHAIQLDRHLGAERDTINADADQLSQAFINFLLNAVDAMADGGGTLTVRTAVRQSTPGSPMAANGEAAGDCIQLDFEDTGCGMSEPDRDRIFDPFFTTKENGIGLGLSVSHGIIEEHGGLIHVESRERAGTAFRIQFPLIGVSAS